MRYLVLFTMLVPAFSLANPWTGEQEEIIAAINRLSATTAPGGAGADAYGAVLAEDFTRWTVGSDLINDRNSWVEGVRDWFEDGWRVSDRQTRYLEIAPRGDIASVRRIVTETYLGPDAQTSVSRAAVAETWVKDSGEWKLLRANVMTMDLED